MPQPAQAQRYADVSEVIQISVLPGWRRDDGVHVAGLQIRLANGWKTYWRSAGSAGIAPSFSWVASRNANAVTTAWPTPTVFQQGQYRSIGYDSDFVLPVLVRPRRPGAEIELRGQLDLGVCADICLPARVSVASVLPDGGSPVPAIQAALRDRPARVNAAARCLLRPTDNGLALTGQIDHPPLGRDEAVVFELPDPRVWVTDSVVRRNGNRISATSELLRSGGVPPSVNRSDVRITIIGDRRAVEIMGCRS